MESRSSSRGNEPVVIPERRASPWVLSKVGEPTRRKTSAWRWRLLFELMSAPFDAAMTVFSSSSTEYPVKYGAGLALLSSVVARSSSAFITSRTTSCLGTMACLGAFCAAVGRARMKDVDRRRAVFSRIDEHSLHERTAAPLVWAVSEWGH